MIVLVLLAIAALWVLAAAFIFRLVAGRGGPPVAVSRYPLIVIYAIILHYVWVGCLIIDPAAGNATSPAGLTRFFGPATVEVLFIVATLAIAYLAIFSNRR